LKVRAVVFDLGKVLVDFDYGIAARNLALRSDASLDFIRALIDQSPLLFRYERAELTGAQFFETVRAQIGFKGTFEEFAAAFGDIFTEISAMTQWHGELSRRGLPTFILSNTNDMAVGHIRRSFSFFRNFAGYILSYEHGVLKPEPRIYEIAEKMSGCRGDEILFLDDRPENIEGAARRGWRTICHHSPAESIQAVQEWVS
jgi:epoxide hydrolase-like predicted phosphatase